MEGTATYQLSKGGGGLATLELWSERSIDGGLTYTENNFSLRTSEVSNNSDNSQTKSSAVGDWNVGELNRWAMYNSGAGVLTIAAPSTVLNNGNLITGLSFYWQLNEV